MNKRYAGQFFKKSQFLSYNFRNKPLIKRTIVNTILDKEFTEKIWIMRLKLQTEKKQNV